MGEKIRELTKEIKEKIWVLIALHSWRARYKIKNKKTLTLKQWLPALSLKVMEEKFGH